MMHLFSRDHDCERNLCKRILGFVKRVILPGLLVFSIGSGVSAAPPTSFSSPASAPAQIKVTPAAANVSNQFSAAGAASSHSIATIATADNPKLQPADKQYIDDTFSVHSSGLGWASPFSVGIMRDSEQQYSWQLQYVRRFNDRYGFAALAEYGAKTYRFGLTLGASVLTNGLFKLSVERLSQTLPFNFDSGSVNQRVYQDAVGAQYQQAINGTAWESINLGGYYARAQSLWLDPIEFSLNGVNATNYRHIAGARTYGVDVGTVLKLGNSARLSGKLHYDNVYYPQVFGTSQNNRQGLGGTVAVTQLLGDRVSVTAEASMRTIYDSYNIRLAWLPPRLAQKMGLEISLQAGRRVSHNDTPSSNSVGMNLTFKPGTIGANAIGYRLPDANTINDIDIWNSTPAVRMAAVLAEIDQLTVVNAPTIAGITPPSGLVVGGTPVVISGANFAGVTAVTFDGNSAISVMIDSPGQITCITPPHAAGIVDVVVVGPGGLAKGSYEYTTVVQRYLQPAVMPKESKDNDRKRFDLACSGGVCIINAAAGANGAISPAGSVSVPYKGSQTFTITPSTGYHIASVVVDGTSVGTPSSYKFSNVTTNRSISATFAINTYKITASAGANGSISPSGVVNVNYGDNKTFSMIPNTGYHVADVKVDGKSVGAVNSYSFVGIAANHTISVTFAINTYTITPSAGAGGKISPSSVKTVNYGGSATFTMTPNTGYHITDVLVDGVSVGAVGTYTFSNVTANHTISVAFAINTYTLTASSDANGNISPSGTVSVNYGGSQTFTMLPNAGYHVASVLVDGVSKGAVNAYTFTNVTANHTISVTFAINTYTITPSAGSGGTISPSSKQTVNYGGSATFTITPKTGYHIADVLIDGTSVGAVETYTFTNVQANHTISATFAINTYTITPSAGSGGTISPATQQTVNYGGSVTFTMTPNAGYHVASVLVDGTAVGTPTSYKFSSVKANHTISVTFAINTYTITPSAGGGGTISPSSKQTVNYGGSVTFTMTANSRYYLKDVKVDGTSVGAVGTYTFTNVQANHTISATFALIPTYTITPSAGSGGTISPSTPQKVLRGGSVTFTMTPKAGYLTTDVLIDGASIGAVGTYTFTNIQANHTIRATFAPTNYTITASSGANGKIDPSGGVNVNYGNHQTFHMTPMAGYHVAEVKVDGVVVEGAPGSYTFARVIANHTISVTFAMNKYTITPAAGPHGVISPALPQIVDYGGGITFNMQPDVGYHIANVLVDGVSVGVRSSYTFANVTATHVINVQFAPDLFAFEATVIGSHGMISPIGALLIPYATNQKFTITPDVEYAVADVLVDGVSVGATDTYTFTNVTDRHTIAAKFVQANSPNPTNINTAVTSPLAHNTAHYTQYRASSSDDFQILSISSNIGPTSGGGHVAITFTPFSRPPATVLVGGVAAKVVTASNGKVEIVMPPHAAGQVHITLSNGRESAKFNNVYTYQHQPLPQQ
jgi:hypothetical protein